MKKLAILLILLLLASISCAKAPTTPQPAPEINGLPSPAPPEVDIPQGVPVIVEKRDYIMRGQFTYLHIYGDGSIVFVEEKGLRMPSRENPPTRTWKTGRIEEKELNELLSLSKSLQFLNLDEYYQFQGSPIPGGPGTGPGIAMGDMSFTVHIDYEDFNKTVTAFGYLTPDHGATYPDMPYPLNELYVRLRNISLKTTEVASETIS